MHKLKFLSLLLVILMLSSCTNQQIYRAFQSNQQLDCQGLPQSQYEECIKLSDESYDSYQQKRDEMKKE